jgi:glycosyltransferase involved in cell wall biosynthesis
MLYNPLVSIVIPVYNGSNFLKEAIDSALAQSYQNTEVIVINDGSNDVGETEQIALSYGDKIRYYYKENGGVASALNLGIMKMKGKYFSWLSHDDLYHPDKISDQICLLNKFNNMPQVIFCNTNIINEKGKLVLETKNSLDVEYISDAIYFFKIWIYACSLLVSKNCFNKIGGFNEKNKTVQDSEFILTLFNYYSFYFLNKSLVNRRDHQNSGFYVLKKLNRQEIFFTLKRLDKQFGIKLYYKNLDLNNKKKVALAYLELADYFISNYKTSLYFLIKSTKFKILGSRLFKSSVKIILKIINATKN